MARDDLDRLSKRGDPVKHETFNEFRRELRRNRVSIAGVPSYQTSGGLVTVGGASTTPIVTLAETTGTISGRTTDGPGTGDGMKISWYESAIHDGEAITLRNLSLDTIASGIFGIAALSGGEWFFQTLGTTVTNQTRIVKTSGTITARSGTTPGSGSAKLQALTSGSFADDGDIEVFNVAAIGWASGKYGVATQISSVWYLVSLEC